MNNEEIRYDDLISSYSFFPAEDFNTVFRGWYGFQIQEVVSDPSQNLHINKN